MKKRKTRKTERLERTYKKYFIQNSMTDGFNGENKSLRQPSYLKVVDSFTTCGITENMLV